MHYIRVIINTCIYIQQYYITACEIVIIICRCSIADLNYSKLIVDVIDVHKGCFNNVLQIYMYIYIYIHIILILKHPLCN